MQFTSLDGSAINDDTWVIAVGTALDNSNALEMLNAIRGAYEGGFRRIIIDMAKLEFLSSAGVGSILGSIEDIREQGGDIILCHLSPQIRHVFEVLDLADYFTMTESRDTACTANIPTRN